MAKIKRNDPCPCGSGEKYKQCCLGKEISADRFSREERGAALEKLESFVEKYLMEEEALVLDELGRYYRNWLDEKIPMLDAHTPREAAADPAFHPKLFELIHGLERMYQFALKEAQPAYDPSWMWKELGFEDHTRSWCAATGAVRRLGGGTSGYAGSHPTGRGRISGPSSREPTS